MSNAVVRPRKPRSRFHLSDARTTTVHRDPFRRRLQCELLEDRRLLSASISGSVWNDLNGNGIQEVGDPGVLGAVVEVFSSTDTTVGNSDDLSCGAAITDANGNYTISGLSPGVNHYLAFRTPVGYTFTTKDAGSDDTKDSDADSTGATAMFTLVPGQTDSTRDAGLVGAAPSFGFALQVEHVSDNEKAVAMDAAGNIYVTSSYQGTTDLDPGPGIYNPKSFPISDVGTLGSYDFFVAKYSPAGALVWACRVGGTGFDDASDITVGEDGCIYTTGAFSGTVDFNPGPDTFNLTSAGYNNTYTNIFVLKLDSAGSFVWARSMGGVGVSRGSGLVVAADGSVYTTGTFAGTADFDPGPLTSSLTGVGIPDVFVSKLDSFGNFVWARRMGGSWANTSAGIAIAPDGSICIAGSFVGTGDFGDFSFVYAGGNDYGDAFVAKLDSAGDFVWAGRMGGWGEDGVMGIAIAADGSVYTTGVFMGMADFDPGVGEVNLVGAGYSYVDTFVCKLDSAGDFVWARSAGGADTYGNGIAVMDNGGVCCTGVFCATVDFDPGPGVFNLTSAGGGDIFVWELDSSGDFACVRSGGGTSYDWGDDVVVAGDGSVFSTGVFRGTANFDPGAGSFDLVAEGNGDPGRLGDIFVWKLLPDHAPTDIFLCASSVAENLSMGMAAGCFFCADPDAGDSFAYTLVSGVGSDDNAAFTIGSDGQLRTAVKFDYETRSSYTIRVRATDCGGMWCEKVFVIAVTGPDDPRPTVTIDQAAGQMDPTGSSTINFAVVFSEAVTGFATGDVLVSGTALPTTAIITGSGANYNVAVSPSSPALGDLAGILSYLIPA